MKAKRLLIVLFVLFNLTSMQAQQPYFELRDLNNQWVTYEDIKGDHLTVIDFWASWCQPCLRSIPKLNELYLDYKDKGVGFVGISIDGPRNQSKLMPFVNSLGIDYPVARDINSEVMTEMNVTSIPTLLIFDADGDLVLLHEGFRPGDEEIIRKKIEQYL